MKTTKTIVVVFCALAAQISLALTETVDGIEYIYRIEGDGAIIENRREVPNGINSFYEYSSAVDQNISSVVKIPLFLGGFPVVRIGNYAFASCTNIKEVVFSRNIIAVGESAFNNCSSLTNVCMNEGLLEISNYAFRACPNLCQAIVSSSVTNIHQTAFKEGIHYMDGVSTNFIGVLFKGDCPNVSGYQNSVTTSMFYTYYGYGKNEAVVCYIVEGSKGWPNFNGYNYAYWQQAKIMYGAVRINQQIGDVIVTNENVIAENDVVTLSCINENATLYYTLDDSEPTTNSTVYSGAIPISKKTTIRAIAYLPSYPYTITETCTYAFGETATPSITMSDGSVFYLSGSEVTLSCETEGAEIRYTLDGGEPTEESTLYTGPFTIDDTTMVRAKAFKEDWFDSETATATFTREWYTVETPAIVPSDTTFANASQTVTISCVTDGATIYYTTDGSDPLENGLVYKRPFAVYKSCTVRAVAVKDDWKDSAEATSVLTRGEQLSEAANFYGRKMETGADVPWVVDTEMSHDGVSSVRSGGDGSYLQMSVSGAGTLSFWWRAMCEDPGYEYYDYGCIKMGGDVVGRIAGEDTGWEYFSTKIASTAKHVFRWEYHKDDEGTFQPDCIWVDQVQWVPTDGSGYTLTTPEAVPYSWLADYGLGVGTDYETAANAASGKMQNGKATKIWEEYVAGTNPTDEDDVFTASITFDEYGRPQIAYTPELSEAEAAKRRYTTYGKVKLTDKEWTEVSDGEEEHYNFFNVTVEMR